MKMSVEQAEKILKDSRYSNDRKRAAKRFLKEAGKGKPSAKKRSAKAAKKTKKVRANPNKRSLKKSKAKNPQSPSRGRSKNSTKTRNKGSKVRRARTKNSIRKNPDRSSGSKIKFFDVANKRHVMIPRDECKLKRNPNSRGGDQLIAKYKGRKLFTFVKKGFKL